ncbi:DUF2207 domain-containing protein [Paenibacillus sp. FSL W8-0186]|uniref:DUF2207 domain-containing protein n=1 Tax=Paenibacillus sp. FSL W8-0186 TaxID=2921709 RepID=UPI0030CFA730
MRRWLWLPLALVIVMLAGCGGSKKFTMEEVDVAARIMPNGDLFVQELFTYRFEGSWNGMTRYVDPKGHGGIEFFEAYIPPEGQHFKDFTYDDLQRLAVDFNKDNDTYFIHAPSADETKRVYYRYRIKGAAVRYADTGELAWSFFKNNNDDIHNVTIDLQLGEPLDEERIHYFLHDRTGGQVSLIYGGKGEASYLRYSNALLDQYGTARLRVLFPAEWISEQAALPEALPLETALAAERERELRLAKRTEHLAIADAVLELLAYGALLVLGLQILPFRRVAGWLLRSRIASGKLEEIDPLLAVYIYRKGRLKIRDMFAGVFSLRHQGLVAMEERQAPRRLLEDKKAPDILPEFVFTGRRSALNETERFFLDKFFYGKKLETERFAGPTRKEKKDANELKRYRRLSERLHADFNKWRVLLDHSEDYHAYVYPNQFQRTMKPAMILIHFLMILALFVIDVSKSSSIIWAVLIVGTLAGFALAYPKKRWLSGLYYFGCFAAAGFLYDSSATGTYAVLIVITFILSLILRPYTLTLEGWKLHAGLRYWRRRLKRGKWYSKGAPRYDTESGLRLAEFAIILDAGPQLLKAMKRRSGDEALQSVAARISQSAVEGLVYSQKAIAYMPPDSSSGSSGGFSGGGGGGGDGGGTGAF